MGYSKSRSNRALMQQATPRGQLNAMRAQKSAAQLADVGKLVEQSAIEGTVTKPRKLEDPVGMGEGAGTAISGLLSFLSSKRFKYDVRSL